VRGVLPSLPEQRPVTPAEQERANAAYERASVLFEEGNVSGAIQAAEETWKAMPNASTAMLRGFLLHHAGRACDALAAYLQAVDLDPQPEEQKRIDAELSTAGAACDPQLGWVRVSVRPEGASVTVAGLSFVAPRTLALPQGLYPVGIVAEGHAELSTSVEVESGRKTLSSHALAELEPPPEVATVSPTGGDGVAVQGEQGVLDGAEPLPPEQVVLNEASDASWRGWVPWTVLGVGVAAAAAGGGMTAWAADAADEANRYDSPMDGLTDAERKARYDEATSSVEARSLASYVLYGVGAAAIVTGVVLAALPGDADETPVVVVPWGQPEGGGVAVHASF
jgi:hypothetical protein